MRLAFGLTILIWLSVPLFLAASLWLTVPRPAAAEPTPGFVEEFTVGTGGFFGGSMVSNPGTGGVDGDGYLRVSNQSTNNFGTRSGTTDYSGNYLAAGITQVRVWMNDVGGNQAFEMHFAIGNGSLNFWQYNPIFSPPENGWAEFVVDLLDSTQFTQTHGNRSFAAAIQSVSNILFRHDLAPYISTPDQIAGELGIDKIQLVGLIPVEPRTWGGIKSLYR